jgi:aminoglycoside phosphotransferase (APT) family kinase protein
MTIADPRAQPLIDLDLSHLRAMVAPVAGGAVLREAVLLEGGLTNTVYQIILAPGGAAMALRVYPPESAEAVEAERRLLAALRPRLPVPHVLWADPQGQICGHPYVIYRWVDGITLNEYRRGALPEELARLGAPIGELLGRISRHPAQGERPVRVAADEVGLARARLRGGLARERLGEMLAQGLERLLADEEDALAALDRTTGLVHGDCGGRNLVVASEGGGPWTLKGILDWDATASGSGLWDVGSFFRYSHRYDASFRSEFASGYRAVGGVLPNDWWRLARLLDATCVVGILEETRPLPRLFAECGLVITALLEECDALG